VSLRKASESVVLDCMGVKEGESVLIIVDAGSRRIGESLYGVSRDAGAEAMLLEILERKLHGEEPPGPVAAAMKSACVVIAPTTKSLSHTDARREASKAGARIASMPGITEEMMERTMSGDYSKIAELSQRVAQALSGGKTARVVSPAGTDITMSIDGRDGHADTGMLREPGAFGNLPAGEAFVSPVEGFADGRIVIDGAMAGVKVLDEPITVTVEKGEVKDIQGGEAARQLSRMIEEARDRNARNLAELGIGTNERAGLSGSLLEVEKVLGTVHLAFGDNKSLGGDVKAPIHVDGVVLSPTLMIDGKAVIRDGKILL